MSIDALVINLDTAEARWDFQQRQLQHLGIAYQRLVATSTQSLDSLTYEQWANDWQRKLRKTEVACFLSHYRAWQIVSDTGRPWLILEDDALLSERLPQVLDSIDIYLQAGLLSDSLAFDHISFETRGRKKLYSRHPLPQVFLPSSFGINLHNLYSDKSGAAAYLLTPKGAKILLDTVSATGAGLADALLCHNESLASLQTVPALALQMDMVTHYQLGLTTDLIQNLSQSSISNSSNHKPTANNLSDTLRFKRRRLLAQAQRAHKQITFRNTAIYQEIKPIHRDFAYLNTLS